MNHITPYTQYASLFLPPPLASPLVDAFDFIFRVSSIDDSGSFRIVSGGNSCDDYGTDLSGLVEVPNTGAWSTFVDIQM